MSDSQGPKLRFRDIEQFPTVRYQVDHSWAHLEEALESYADRGESGQFGGLDLSPDYQRAHVWSYDQQQAFVEYQLMGGEVGKILVFNCPDWGMGFKHPLELVDGKQRLESVRAFMRGDLEVFGGHRIGDFDKIPAMHYSFKFHICSLKTRADILKLYLKINAGGTPHTRDELDRVRAMLIAES